MQGVKHGNRCIGKQVKRWRIVGVSVHDIKRVRMLIDPLANQAEHLNLLGCRRRENGGVKAGQRLSRGIDAEIDNISAANPRPLGRDQTYGVAPLCKPMDEVDQ